MHADPSSDTDALADTDPDAQQRADQALYEAALEYALTYMVFPPRTQSQIHARLTRRGNPPQIVDRVLARMGELGYADDSAVAAGVVRAKSRRQGRSALRRTLLQAGVSPELADDALTDLNDDTDYATAVTLLERKQRSVQGLDPHTAHRRLMGMLTRRGIRAGVAARAIRDTLTPGSPDEDALVGDLIADVDAADERTNGT